MRIAVLRPLFGVQLGETCMSQAVLEHIPAFLGETASEVNWKSGRLVVWRKTVRKRMRAKLADIKKQLRARIDAPPGETGQWPRRVVRGYFPYHGMPGKRRMLAGFR